MRLLDQPFRWLRFLRRYGHWPAVGFLSLGAVLLPSVLTHSSRPENAARPTENTNHAEPPPSWRVVDVKLRRGDTLTRVLMRFGLARSAAHAAAEAIRPLFNPRDFRAGETLRLLLDPQEQRIEGIEYILESALLRAITTEKGWSAELKETPFVSETKVVHGSVADNLYQDGIGVGLAPLQIIDLATVFESDIDFFSDFQKGDLFSVAFEERRYADGRRSPGRMLAAEVIAGGKPFHAIHFERKEGEGGYYDLKGLAVKRAFLRAPLSFYRISSRYSQSRRHPIFRTARPHRAIDYAAPAGTPVVAIGRGRVTHSGWKGGYGRLVEIRHTNGYVTRYAHFSRIAGGMRVGKHVDQGDVIGYVGQSGHATGPHLHFEILRAGKKINFLTMKSPPGNRLKGSELERFENLRDRRLALLQEKPITLARSNP
jgi:murein DD-endopeptidase MepM/ murein hydrolase activator NlpD